MTSDKETREQWIQRVKPQIQPCYTNGKFSHWQVIWGTWGDHKMVYRVLFGKAIDAAMTAEKRGR